MKIRFHRILLPLFALLIATGCGKRQSKLHIYIWSDYLKPEIVQAFETKFGCKVVLDYYDSNETMYAKLQAGGAGYDIVVPSSYMVNIMKDQGMLLPLDHSLIPNVKHIDPASERFTMDPTHQFSLPYMLGSTGLGVLSSKVEDFSPSWTMFANAAYKSRMTMLNDYREAIGAALKASGYSLNTTNEAELLVAQNLLITWKRNLAKFESEQYKNGLISSEFVIVQGYSGDIMQLMEENEDIAYVVPHEGTSVALDEIAILKGARQPELAHAFLNFVHEPQNAASNIEFVYYLCPNLPAYDLVAEDVRNDPAVFLPEDVLNKSEVVLDLGAANAMYSKVWDAVKAAD